MSENTARIRAVPNASRNRSESKTVVAGTTDMGVSLLVPSRTEG
jgi:hypothetical protein